MRAATLLALAAPAFAAAPQAAQDAHRPPPVFEAQVDLVAVDVTVVDQHGHAVMGLEPEDFTLAVGGRPRRVVSVEYVSVEPAVAPPPADGPVENSSNEWAARGRLVLVAVDQGSLRPGQGRLAIDSLDRLLDRLAPGDRVGLVAFPPPGPSVELTDDHSEVRRALGRIVGRASARPEDFSLSEALAYDDRRPEWDQVELRECPLSLDENRRFVCLDELRGRVVSWLNGFRAASEASARTLEALFEALERIDGSKTVVLLSHGLLVEGAARVQRLAQSAAESQAALYVVQLEQPGPDITQSRPARDELLDRGHMTAGLDTLASLARGAVFNVAGGGQHVFDRIGREISGHYVIGFEPEPEDRDGRQHRVQVAVRRPDAQVRLRRLLRIPPAEEGRPDAQRELTRVLASPLPATGVPLRVATYATRDPGSQQVRLLLSAEIGRDDSAPPAAAVAYVLRTPPGAMVASGFRPAPLEAPAGDGPARFLGAALVEPGRYRLKLAVLDARGRRGSVEHEVSATLVSAGDVELSDLMLAPVPESGRALHPPALWRAGRDATLAYVEVYGDPARVQSGSVELALADSEASPPLVTFPPVPVTALAREGDATEAGRHAARVPFLAGALPPGTYVARATLRLAGRPVAAVSRRLELREVVAEAGEAPGLALSELAPLLERFDLAQALAPDVTAGFLARLPHLEGETPRVRRALASASSGRLAGLVDELAGESTATPTTFFLRALGYLAGGQVAPAVTQLEALLRADSAFLPAAFYLGACHAAQGRDLQAAGAWQTALVSENAPALFSLLADAWMRAGEAGAAADTLREGLEHWPGEPRLERRLAWALAVTGPEAEALRLLDRQVEREPADLGSLFVALRLLLRTHIAGRAGAEETARLRRHGRAYVEARGPQRELVARWLAWIDRR